MKSRFTAAAAAMLVLIIGTGASMVGRWIDGHEYRAVDTLSMSIFLIVVFGLGYGAGRVDGGKK